MAGTPKFELVIDEMRRTFLSRADDAFDCELEAVSSPIEKVFLATMLAHLWESASQMGVDATRIAMDAAESVGLYFTDNTPGGGQREYLYIGGAVYCVTQYELVLDDRNIHPDFAFFITGEDATKIIVELDGHDFHERTPEQAQSDKSRDRKLQALGWHVLRFTGREVLRRPYECLQEVIQLLFAKRATRMALERAEGGR